MCFKDSITWPHYIHRRKNQGRNILINEISLTDIYYKHRTSNVRSTPETGEVWSSEKRGQRAWGDVNMAPSWGHQMGAPEFCICWGKGASRVTGWTLHPGLWSREIHIGYLDHPMNALGTVSQAAATWKLYFLHNFELAFRWAFVWTMGLTCVFL